MVGIPDPEIALAHGASLAIHIENGILLRPDGNTKPLEPLPYTLARDVPNKIGDLTAVEPFA